MVLLCHDEQTVLLCTRGSKKFHDLYAAIDRELSETPEAFWRDGEDFNSCVPPNYEIQVAWSREVTRIANIDRSWVLCRHNIIVRHPADPLLLTHPNLYLLRSVFKLFK